MRGEEIVVAAELTGKLGHPCFFCKTRHVVKGTVKNCAKSFVTDVFGYPVMTSNVSLPSPNRVAMMKLGLMEEGERYETLKVAACFRDGWEPNWQDFVMCENVDEAYEVAKARLAVWRDEAFQKYSYSVVAKHRCLTEFGHLLRPSKDALANPKRLNVQKVMSAHGLGIDQLVVDGRPTQVYEVTAFYKLFWPSAPNAKILDVDLNADKAVLVEEKWVSGQIIKTHMIVRFNKDWSFNAALLAAPKPVEDC